MRVVLDTNVLARAVRGGTGPAAELLRLMLLPPQVFILSPFLLSELSRVLRYPRLQKLHNLDDNQLDAYVQALQAAALVVSLPAATATFVVAADPDDNPVVATAVVGQAEVLCTLDRHLLNTPVRAYCAARAIQVLTDVELLPLLRGAGGSAVTP